VESGRRASQASVRAQLNLRAVESSLRRLQRHLRADASVSPRDPFDDRVLDNLLAGYARVDALVADGIDVFAMGQLRHVLELNVLVLCGTSAARRDAYARHIEASERRFYEEPDGGIRDVVEWHQTHQGEAPAEHAAGVFARMQATPQLFIEGNHRTGALLMSYVLLLGGEPPFVLSPEAAPPFFDLASALRDVQRRSPAGFLQLPAVRQALVALLIRHADPAHLLH